MMYMHNTIQMQTAGRGGGFLKGLAVSALGGESFFVNTYTATHGPGEIAFVGPFMGDIRAVNLQGNGYVVQSGAYLANSPGVMLDTKWQGLKGYIGMKDAVMLRASGQGTLYLTTFGGVIERDLQPGETLRVDNGHIAAFQEHMNFNISRAAKGFKAALFGGEGLVCDFTGPGRVIIQTRQLGSFAAEIARLLPNRG
jgi:uncharacterized protein (TIGR00266 family)